MNSSLTSRVPASLDKNKLEQLSYLCVLLVGINKACMKREGITYASGSGTKEKTLTEVQKFFSKLAMICDTQKGEWGRTVTALVCLMGTKGPEYVFTSNYRKEAEFEETKSFLFNLLTFVGTNPNKLESKPLQKQVLWKILEFNFDKLEFYIRSLIKALDNCINYENHREPPDSQTTKQLILLQDKANFSCDIASSVNSHDKCLRDCETLIKAIQASKTGSFEKVLQSRAVEKDANSADNWCRLRHYLGRLHSYRQASEIIVAAATTWPDLFKNIQVNYILSAHQKHTPTPKSSNLDQIIPIAFPEHKASDFESDIAELQIFDLDDAIQKQLQSRRIKTMVHAEAHLHNYLIQKGKTSSADFWSGSMFIATSKPTCRLCQYYFNSPTNSFQVQTSHLNIYPKFRLPDIYEDQGAEAKEHYEEVLQDIIEQMQHDTLEMLKQKVPRGKTNDSRTDSHSRASTRTTFSRAALTNPESITMMGRQPMNQRLPSPVSEDDEWEQMRSEIPHAR